MLTLLGVAPGYPQLQSNPFSGVVNYTYDSSTSVGTFDLTGTPFTYQQSAADPSRLVFGPSSFEIHFKTDGAGNIDVANSALIGTNFSVVGSIDLNGNFAIDPGEPTGTLLEGTILQFGYRDETLTTDSFDFRFKPTTVAPALAPYFAGQDVGVTFGAENSSFDGNFTHNFTGSPVKAIAGPLPPLLHENPTINTVAGATVVIGDGTKLNDTAVLAGGVNPTGTITFTLFNPSNVAVYTDVVTVNGNGSYNTLAGTNPGGFLPAAVGTYLWTATYSGDSNNAGASDNGQNENEAVSPTQPAINTVAGSAVIIGDGTKLVDTAVLSGGYNPTGTITFTLYNPSNVAVYTDVVPVNGNGSYNTLAGTNPGGFLPAAVGTYLWTATYSGDSNNIGAADNGQNENEAVSPTKPAINTVAGATVVIGDGTKLVDTAVLSGGYNPTGTITFTLYNPANVAVYTDVVTVNGNGSYNTLAGTNPGGFLPAAVGTYLWTATYSGDSNNIGAADNGQNENEAVSPTKPAINTVAGATVVIGDGTKLVDTAVLSGGYNPTGTITFTLYNPANVAVYTDVVTVNGNGSYNTLAGTNPGGFLPAAVGTYLWTATYSGDSNNIGAADNGQNENEAVNKAGPAINTVAGATVVIGDGTKLVDTAVLSGGYNPTGTITFTLYNPSNVAVYTDVVTVNGNGSYNTLAGTNPGGFLPAATGTYLWKATYSGDSNNAGAADNGQNENEAVSPTRPAINTVAGSATVIGDGTKLVDTAVLSGGYNPTGTITFTLYSPSNVAVYTDVVTVNGNGSYNTLAGTNPGGFLPAAVGTYLWKATYSGDSNNAGAADNGQNENEAVSPTKPAINTVAGATVVIGDGTKLVDTAVLSGGYNPTGTITFTLYNPSNVAVYTDVVTVNGNGSYNTLAGTNPGGFLPAAMGTYLWKATYSGDSNNAGAADNGQNENEAVVPRNPGIDIEKTTNGPTNSNPIAPDYDNEDAANGPGVPLLTPGSTVTWTYKVTNTGNIPFTFAQVVVTDDNGTPANTADDLSTTGGQITFQSVLVGDADNILEPGEVWLYKASGTVQTLTTGSASATTISMTGNTATTGTAGNVRTFSSGGISVNASGFSRDKTTGAWAAGYLGDYSGGLGVTDTSEDGSNPSHTVDNVGRNNYVLFEFNQSVVVDAATLGYVVTDSDMQIWIGTFPNAFTSHQTLSDAFLTSLGFTEMNTTTLSTTRTANLNAGGVAGNVLVIAADPTTTTPDDQFKIASLIVAPYQPGYYENKGTVTVPGGTDSDLSHYRNPQKVTIGDFVWNDVNANGIQDSGEAGIPGVTLTLSNGDHATTDSTGHYLFTEAPGTYTVTVDSSNFTGSGALAAYIASPTLVGGNRAVDSNLSPTGTTPAALPGGSSDLTLDFGYFKPVSISGHKYLDVTGNGMTADDKLNPMSGVTIQLYKDVDGDGQLTAADGLPVASQQTASDGSYNFTGLVAGKYLVTEVVPTGYVRTGPALSSFYAISLASGGASVGNDFDNAMVCCQNTLSQISYVVNHNGYNTTLTDLRGHVQQGDTVTANFTLTLGSAGSATFSLVSYTAPGSYFDATVANQQDIFAASTMTYTQSGTYSLTVTVPACYFQVDFVCGVPIDTFGPSGSNIYYGAQNRLFSADNGGTVACCGNKSSLTGNVYYDANLSNLLDLGDSGISGVTVKLYNSSNALVATTTTNSNGFYSFMNLAAGTYKIVEVSPAGYIDAASNPGNLGGGTSTNDTIDTIVLPTSTIGYNYNFGEVKPSTLSGSVYVDCSNDGVKQNSELGVFGVTVQLVDQSSTVVATTTTAADGSYSFTGIVPGKYSVVEIQPAAYVDGIDTAGSLGGTAGNDIITSVNIGSGVSGTGYNFGETKVCGSLLVGDTATIGFWANCNGQALITSLNGGPNATNLGNWMASNFPKIYGNKSSLNLAGKTNTQVAAQFVTFKNASGSKLDAQVMAVVLAMYVTDSDLSGTVAKPYGFNVSTTGTGAKTINVGANGAAFSVSNNSNITVMNAVLAVNNQAVNGNLYGTNTSLENMANIVFSNINQNGDRIG